VITRFAVENRTVTYFAVFLLVVGGIGSYFSLGQLEDPEFTVKTALVSTAYPGASPREVELEVTDRIEKAVQELPQVKHLYSTSIAGLSVVKVDIHDKYWADELPQVWDEMRSKIRDIESQLPPGAQVPIVTDDFNFVYGFVLAVTGDGFSPEQLDAHVDHLRRELALVTGVSRADQWGEPDRVIYVDVSERQLSELGLSIQTVASTLQKQNMVVDAGRIDLHNRRFRIAPTGAFESPDDIADLVIQPSLTDTLQAEGDRPRHVDALLRIRDIATVHAGLVDPPNWELRFNGVDAQGIALANVSGGNVVDTGRAIDRRLRELVADLPVGIEVHKVSWQSDEVSAAVDGFLVSLAQAVAIVLLVLTVPMGWRMGVVIGCGLLLTILATFLVMSIVGIDLQRMSLGALVIALGMMVDNAIVVADGMAVRLQRGTPRKQAAIESASAPSVPLLGATIVAVMAFYPVFASPANAGEYCRTLFSVVAIALVASWLIAMTITPLQCIDLLKAPDAGGEGADPFGGGMYQRFRGLLLLAIRRRFLFIGGMVGLLVASIVAFGGVRQMFFPDSSRPQLMLDYWGPEGTRIQDVSQALRPIEARIAESPYAEAVTAFVGEGPPRFYLPVDPQGADPSYGQIIVNTASYKDIDPLIAELEPWIRENVHDAMVRVRKYGVGPSETWPFEARFSGPAEADLGTLRGLAAQGVAVLIESPDATDIRTDMRERVRKLVPEFHDENARRAGISREDIARSTKRAFDGAEVGLYRERDDLYPILLRHAPEERKAAIADLEELQVQPGLSTEMVPLASVTREVAVEWEDPIIIRFDRRRAVTVQGAAYGVTFPTLRANVLADIDAIELPPGYQLFWDGEQYSTEEAQKGLMPGITPAIVIILFIIVALFNAMRPPLIIIASIPFLMVGVSFGLLLTGPLVDGAAFGFVALLGAMSLAGMMIKSAIVLLDQINIELAAGKAPLDAIVDAAIERLRPVALAAGTTVLGVIPLLQDVFWVAMSVAIMAGLTFGTIVTMFLVPVLYATFHRVPSEGEASTS
jgi:multidrug efflux pump subunit AcrB